MLGITRTNGDYVGVPRGDTRLEPGDTVMLYGRESAIAELDQRRAGVGGHLRHAEAVVEQAERDRQGEGDASPEPR
jgi:hypothetical protein